MKTNLSFNLIALLLVLNIIAITLEFFASMPIVGTIHLMGCVLLFNAVTRDNKSQKRFG